METESKFTIWHLTGQTIEGDQLTVADQLFIDPDTAMEAGIEAVADFYMDPDEDVPNEFEPDRFEWRDRPDGSWMWADGEVEMQVTPREVLGKP